MKEQNIDILKQICAELRLLGVCNEEELIGKRKELSRRVSEVLEDEQRRLDECLGEEGIVVTDEKMNALFSANAILHAIPKNETEMKENVKSAIGKLERCVA